MHPELLVRKRIWLMTLTLAGLFLLVISIPNSADRILPTRNWKKIRTRH